MYVERLKWFLWYRKSFKTNFCCIHIYLYIYIDVWCIIVNNFHNKYFIFIVSIRYIYINSTIIYNSSAMPIIIINFIIIKN